MAHGGGDDTPDHLTSHIELRKERDFYFSKLRDIEIICLQSGEDKESPFIQRILSILYSIDDGFSLPRDRVLEHEKNKK